MVRGTTMWELLADISGREALTRAALLFAAIAAITGLGALIVARFRGGMKEDRHPTSELLTKFRDLHDGGKISDTEFRNIKTLLSDQHRDELNSNKQQG
jgi:hypothetical protein